MRNNSVLEAELKAFIQVWFHMLDKHPDSAELLPMVSEAVVMKMPDGEFQHHEGFKQWYQSVEQFRDQSHIVKALNIVIEGELATVKLINQWQRSDANAENPEERLGFYAAQTWTIQRSLQSQKLVIVTYTVDYFLPEN